MARAADGAGSAGAAPDGRLGPAADRAARAGPSELGPDEGRPVRRAGGDERYGPHVGLLVVDVQNDFADPAGSLSVQGGAEIVPRVGHEIERATDARAFVVYTQDWHPPHTPHFAQDGGVWPVHCVAGTAGAELFPGLPVAGPIVRKGSNGEDGYSGFSMRDPSTGETMPTELDGLLKEHGVTSVVICGLATDYCVKATALDAVRLGYATAVLADAIRAVDVEPGDGDRAIDEMTAAGVTVLAASAATAG